MLEVFRVVNEPVSSCCYLVYDKEINNNCIIIDPGSESNCKLYSIFGELQLIPEFIILTHEHFDHCWGVNDLRKRYENIKLICSSDCNKAIQREKGNCSVFYDNKRTFEINGADFITQEIHNVLVWNSHEIKFEPTPGHSSASISIIIENVIFTGDALIKGLKTVVKLPTGSALLQKETEKYFQTLTGYLFYPGHGDSFYL